MITIETDPSGGSASGSAHRPLLAAAAFLAFASVLGVLLVPGAGAAPVGFAAAVALELAVAAAFWTALGLRDAARTGALVTSCMVLALAPLLVPPHGGAERVMAAIVGVALMMKLYDVAASTAGAGQPSARTYLGFLPNLTSMSLRGLSREPRPSSRETVRRLAGAVLLAGFVVVLVRLARRVAWADWPFAVEHGAKALLLFVGFVAVMDVLTHATRLGGGAARDVNRSPWRARTPAEFWRRYNRTIGQFLEDHVFRPALRRGWPPALAVMAAFAISGVLHEYIFSVASGRVEGYQTAFFLVNGAGVAVTARLRPRGRLAILAGAGTLAFILASGVLFFLSVDGVVSFYAARTP